MPAGAGGARQSAACSSVRSSEYAPAYYGYGYAPAYSYAPAYYGYYAPRPYYGYYARPYYRYGVRRAYARWR
jgi:hypothetical protein